MRLCSAWQVPQLECMKPVLLVQHSADNGHSLKNQGMAQALPLQVITKGFIPFPRSVVLQWVSAAPYPQVVEFGPRQPGHSTQAATLDEAVAACAAAAQASLPDRDSAESDVGRGLRVHEEEGMRDSEVTGSESSDFGFSSITRDVGIKPDSVQPVTCITKGADRDSYQFR